MADERSKQDCKYGAGCYQKNEHHRNKYRHPEQPPSDLPPRKRMRLCPAIKMDTADRAPNTQKLTNGDCEQSPSAIDETTTSDSVAVSAAPAPALGTVQSSSNRTDSGFEHNVIDYFEKDIELAEQAEYDLLVKCPKLFIKHKFLVEMPADFFSFWQFCLSMADNRESALKILDPFGIRLVGPFDVMAGKFEKAKRLEPGDYLRHWRFFYDPPEFQTILVKEKSGIHYGYWRDDPESTTALIARNDANKGYEIEIKTDNIFTALLSILDTEVTSSPFNQAACGTMKKSITAWVDEHSINLTSGPDAIKERNKLVVAKTFHRAGIVVPFDRKKDVGYRALIESDANIKKILNHFDKDKVELEPAVMGTLQPIITAAQIAVDEHDFGTALELGIDLFSFGMEKLHSIARWLLITGYTMTQRPRYIAIMKAHLEKRRQDYALCCLTAKA